MSTLHGSGRKGLKRIVSTALAGPMAIAGVLALQGLTGGVASASTAGSLGVTGGSLSQTVPASLTWAATLAGLDQAAVDGNVGDQAYTVTDATGSGSGWNVNVNATTFTCTSTAAAGTCQPSNGVYNEQYLPQTYNSNGIFWTNGSTSSANSTSSPTTGCSSGSTCTPIVNGVSSYPVYVTPGAAGAAGSSAKILSSTATNGLGKFDVSSVGWWVEIPANTYVGTYTSTITVAINSGP